ncbi:uncharacterized protein LOC112577088 isoform X6 [Pomacea canaliculata]|uniref:uncharacterized protein LOC112577088 isoform X6 n=1 Tax=Pomacea canaliculata TaxID=400727 RepID=UPI000D726005|nr:uncharacterized protein LOC112577088 isoform X6 [Pomacea canaliculata]
MAMSYHMEARIKQERLDRWNRIKQMPLSDESKELSNTPEKFVPGLIEPRCTDSGQFDMRDGNERSKRIFKNWNPPKKQRPVEPTPKPPPETVRSIKRDNVYRILHPYEFH